MPEYARVCQSMPEYTSFRSFRTIRKYLGQRDKIQNKPKILEAKRQNAEETENTWGKETRYRTNRKYLGQRDKIQNKPKILGTKRQNTEQTENTWGKETKY